MELEYNPFYQLVCALFVHMVILVSFIILSYMGLYDKPSVDSSGFIVSYSSDMVF